MSLSCITKFPTSFCRTYDSHHRPFTNTASPSPHGGSGKGRLGNPVRRPTEQARLLGHSTREGWRVPSPCLPMALGHGCVSGEQQSQVNQTGRKQITWEDAMLIGAAPSTTMAPKASVQPERKSTGPVGQQMKETRLDAEETRWGRGEGFPIKVTKIPR